MSYVHFTVPGIPAPQGSKTPWGTEANPRTKPWRAAVAAAAADVVTLDEHILGPAELTVVFFFPRPKSHYRTGKHAGVLRDNAPDYCATKPDADKLLRAIGDALTGIVVRDDSQFVKVTATKLYGQPRAEIVVSEIVSAGSPFAKAAA